MTPEIEQLVHRLTLDMIQNPTSYRKLAKKLNIGEATLKRVLSGQGEPFLETVLKIEKYLLKSQQQ